MGCGASKHAVARENTIGKSKSKNSIEEKENLITKEPGVVVVDVNVEEKEKENAKVSDNNGKGESRMEEKENVILLTDNGNGKSEGDEESVKEKLDSAPVVIVEGNKSDEISVPHQVQEPEEEKLKNGHLNDDIAINQEVKEDSKTEEAIHHIHVEEEKEVVVLPIAETKVSATKGGE